MCRSAAHGGRRCPGSSRPSTTPGSSFTSAAAPATAPTAPIGGPLPTGPGAPSPAEPSGPNPAAAGRTAFLREHGYTGPIDADGNATATTTRTTDGLGRPLAAKDARFFALREAGYTGPLDQNSNPTGAHADVFAALDQATTRAQSGDTTGPVGPITSTSPHATSVIGSATAGRSVVVGDVINNGPQASPPEWDNDAWRRNRPTTSTGSDTGGQDFVQGTTYVNGVAQPRTPSGPQPAEDASHEAQRRQGEHLRAELADRRNHPEEY